MNKLLATIFIILTLIFSGCSSLGGNSTGSDKEIDKSGYGLEVDFDLNTRLVDDSGKLIYSIVIKNTGLKPIDLKRENFRLRTIEKNSKNNYYFSEQSLRGFYDKVFDQEQSLRLVNDQQRRVEGTILIDESFYDVATNTDLNYALEIKYDYETIFSNNIELQEEYGLFNLNKLDKVSQAAPVQISDIILIPGKGDTDYIIEYEFDDRGKNYFSEDKTSIGIDDINLKFGSKEITNNCYGIYKKGDDKIDEREISDLEIKGDEKLSLRCDVDITQTSSFTTKTSGNFKYDYKVKLGDSINIRD